jgi:BNR repeat-like domain
MATTRGTLLQRLVLAALGALALVLVATSQGAETRKRAPLVVRVSRDAGTATAFQHQTSVEPSIAAGRRGVLVTVYQVGRSFSHGSASIGWATSRDGGRHWRRGRLTPITRPGVLPATALDITDPVVTYDAVHGAWIAASIADFANGSRTLQVHRSTDGLRWSTPIEVAKGIVDKDWMTCDRSRRSRFRGRCYVVFARENEDRLGVRWSSDGGLTWSAETPIRPTLGHPTGAVPATRPNGRLVIVFREGGFLQPGEYSAAAVPPWTLTSTSSDDGGATFGPIRTRVALAKPYFPPHTRAVPTAIPSMAVDVRGRLYVVWQSCRFRRQCVGNDLALSTSADGRRWTRPRRLPLGRTGDRVVPGLAIAPGKAGRPARLGLTYYLIANDGCRPARCRLTPYFTSSTSGGRTWTRPLRLYPAIRYRWLAQSPAGQAFIGDYTATAFVGRVAYSAFAIATRPTRGRLHHSIAVARIRPVDLPQR